MMLPVEGNHEPMPEPVPVPEEDLVRATLEIPEDKPLLFTGTRTETRLWGELVLAMPVKTARQFRDALNEALSEREA